MLFRSNNGLGHILFINSFCCVTVAPDQQSWHGKGKDGLGRKALSYAEQQGLPGADKLLVTLPFFSGSIRALPLAKTDLVWRMDLRIQDLVIN